MGNRITRAAGHLPVEAVQERIRKEKRPWLRQRWEIIYQALTAHRHAEDIARTVGVSISTVHGVMSMYKRGGVAAIETAGKGGAASPVPDSGTRTQFPPTVLRACSSRRESTSRRDPGRTGSPDRA